MKNTMLSAHSHCDSGEMSYLRDGACSSFLKMHCCTTLAKRQSPMTLDPRPHSGPPEMPGPSPQWSGPGGIALLIVYSVEGVSQLYELLGPLGEMHEATLDKVSWCLLGGAGDVLTVHSVLEANEICLRGIGMKQAVGSPLYSLTYCLKPEQEEPRQRQSGSCSCSAKNLVFRISPQVTKHER